MVWNGSGFKKENIPQRDMAHHFSCPQGECFCRNLTLRHQMGMYLTQALRCRRTNGLRPLDNVVKRLQMILKCTPGQIPIAGDVNQGTVRIPLPKLTSQPEAIPFLVLQLHIQKVDALFTVFYRVQQLLRIGCAAHHIHIIIFHENLPLQSGLNLVADNILIITKINPDHSRPSTVNS